MNTVLLNTVHLNHASLNVVGERLRASAGGGGGEVIPPDVPVTYTLSASASNGVVSASVNGVAVTLPYTANEGDVVIVEVTANDGYEFEGWADGSTDNPRSITMTADVTLSAECVAVVVKDYIQFADAEVERVLIANGVSSDGVGITKEDAEAVTRIGTWFRNNATIVSFNELQYFTQVTQLLPYVFGSCTALTSINLLNVVTISNNAFNGCTSLQSIGSTDKVETIDNNAFYRVQSLDDAVNLPKCAQLGGYAFRDTSITALYIPLVKAIPTYLCENDKALARIDISGAETIGQNAFNGCSALTDVGNMGKVVSIGSTAFRETGINSDVSIPSCTTISANAFRGCASMTGIYAPTSTFLGNYCFAYCAAMTYAEFGELTTIENMAFYGCTSLERIIIRATTPPALGNINAFQSTNNCPIYVPDASVEAYKTATNWSTYALRIKPISDLSPLRLEPEGGFFSSDTIEIKAIYNGEEITPVWTVESDVATISTNGILTFTGIGSASVTATYNGVSRTKVYNHVEAYTVDKMFTPSTTSDASQIINTEYKLFSDEMTQWTLRVALSDIDFSKMANNGSAVTCGDESGSPYAGIYITKNAGNSSIKMDINPNGSNIINTAAPPTIIIRRNGDTLESSTDGGTTYVTRMASIASVVSTSPRLATIPMIVGGYYSNTGTLGRPFYGRVKLELYFEVKDFND